MKGNHHQQSMTSTKKEWLIPAALLRVITKNRPAIIDNLDTGGLFLDVLLQKDIISQEFYSSLVSVSTDGTKNTLLLDYILKCSQQALDDFVSILQQEEQSHIAQMFTLDETHHTSTDIICVAESNQGNTELISEEQRNIIEGNRPDIIRCLRIEDELLNKLLSQGIISSETASLLRCLQLDGPKNTTLLDKVLKLSQQELNGFIMTLCEDKQGHVAELFKSAQENGRPALTANRMETLALPGSGQLNESKDDSAQIEIYQRSRPQSQEAQPNNSEGQNVMCRRNDVDLYNCCDTYNQGVEFISENHRDQIEYNREDIIQNLDLEEGILSKVQARHILPPTSVKEIRCLPVDHQKNSLFLDYLLAISPKKMEAFVEILREEKQAHVAQLFRYKEELLPGYSEDTRSHKMKAINMPYAGGGSSCGPIRSGRNRAHLDVSAKCSSITPKSDVNTSIENMKKQLELNLLTSMNDSLLRMNSKTTDESEQHKQSFEYFKNQYIQVISIIKGSVILTLEFGSVECLDSFWIVYTSGRLKDMFQQDFITGDLLDELNLEAAELDVYIKENEFAACREELQDDDSDAGGSTQSVEKMGSLSLKPEAKVELIENRLKIYKTDKTKENAILTSTTWRPHAAKIRIDEVHKIWIKRVYFMDCMQLFGFISKCQNATEIFMVNIQDGTDGNSLISKDLSAALASLPKLKSFDLWSTNFGREGRAWLQSLSGNHDLRVLSLHDSDISGCGQVVADSLTKLPKLGVLNLIKTGLNRNELKLILELLPGCCPQISGLLLGGLDLTGVGLDQAVQELPGLKALTFKKSTMPMSDLMSVMRNTSENIELLGILHVKVGTSRQIDAKEMCDILNKHRKIRAMHVSEDQLGFAGWIRVKYVLEQNGGRLLSEAHAGGKEWEEYMGYYSKIVKECVKRE